MSKFIDTVTRFLKDFSKGPLILDKIISQSEIVTVNGVKYVRKRYAKEVGIMKWLPPVLFLKPIYPFTLEPKERLQREVKFFSMSWRSFHVPKILKYDINKLEILREYIAGDVINYKSINDVETLAKVYAEVHSTGYSLGDVKPTNFLKDEKGNIYVIDAEQAVKSEGVDAKSWDLIATVLLSSYTYIANMTGFKNFLKSFLKGYLDNGGSDKALTNMMSQRFSGLIILIPLPHLVTIIEVLESIL